MHFFYLDESGCSGADLNADQDPIFVLGGISVKDQGWVASTEAMDGIIQNYFAPNGVPAGFELHAHELLSPNGQGFFDGHPREERNALAFELLDLLDHRGHQVQYIAIDKTRLADTATGDEHGVFDARIPYLLGFDYLTTYINQRVKEALGHTARGIIILDEKDMFDDAVARITRFRRFEVPKVRRIKWLVEFSYPIDSRKHPMIQLTDLVAFCTRKFFEMDKGYRDEWPGPAVKFYARCFEKIYSRVWKKTLVVQEGVHAGQINALLGQVRLVPRHAWRNHYGLV